MADPAPLSKHNTAWNPLAYNIQALPDSYNFVELLSLRRLVCYLKGIESPRQGSVSARAEQKRRRKNEDAPPWNTGCLTRL